MNGKKKTEQSIIEIFLSGNNIRINEFYSTGITEIILKHAEKEYGVVFHKKFQSMCG